MIINSNTAELEKEFEIVDLKSGKKSLKDLMTGETFHPVTGPWFEANVLHVEQQRLVKRCSDLKNFVIWDVGFGAAANSIAAVEALKDSKSKIEIISFDKSTRPIEFALKHSNELEYLDPYTSAIKKLLLKSKVKLTPTINWTLEIKDFREVLKSCNFPFPHAIFYDPYSPATNPEMWTLEHFRMLKKCLNPKRPCLITSYSRSTSMRTTLLLAGFFVGKGREIGEKSETTLASNQLKLLKETLDQSWLKRVQNSTNSAPLRSEQYSKSRISKEDFELLSGLPQFTSSS